jgi:hypothetical protein
MEKKPVKTANPEPHTDKKEKVVSFDEMMRKLIQVPKPKK